MNHYTQVGTKEREKILFFSKMYLKHIEKNVVICYNKLLKEMEGEHEKSFIYFNRSDLGNGIFGVRDEKHSTDWYG